MRKSEQDHKGIVVDETAGTVTCKVCGRQWSPQQRPGQVRMSPGWWRCPYGLCNSANRPPTAEEWETMADNVIPVESHDMSAEVRDLIDECVDRGYGPPVEVWPKPEPRRSRDAPS